MKRSTGSTLCYMEVLYVWLHVCTGTIGKGKAFLTCSCRIRTGYFDLHSLVSLVSLQLCLFHSATGANRGIPCKNRINKYQTSKNKEVPPPFFSKLLPGLQSPSIPQFPGGESLPGSHFEAIPSGHHPGHHVQPRPHVFSQHQKAQRGQTPKTRWFDPPFFWWVTIKSNPFATKVVDFGLSNSCGFFLSFWILGHHSEIP